ncbi:MAG: non-ribosomal peptide synthetase [Chroococcales cyanobacterium]
MATVGRITGVIVYNTDLFDSSAIALLRQHFQTLLEGIVANPNTPLFQLPLLTLKEEQALLQRWGENESNYPAEVCIHELFEAQVKRQPTAIALSFKTQQFTYEQLNQGSNQLARYLQRLGVENHLLEDPPLPPLKRGENVEISSLKKEGDGGFPSSQMAVGICLDQSAEAIAAMLAVLKAGGIYVPLNPNYPVERLHFMIEDAGIGVVITRSEFADLFPNTQVICLEEDWDAIAQESNENLSSSVPSNGLAYIIYTSGSTGIPKGVMVPHRAVNRLVLNTNYIQIEASDRIAQVANLAFDAATFEIWGALLNGAQLMGIDREITLSPTDFVRELQQQEISILFLTTALLNQTVSQIPNGLRSLKYLLFGGEMVNVDRVRSLLKEGKPQHLIHVYGPTENTTFSTWYEVQEIPENATTIPIGQAIANTQVYLLDENLHPVPPGVSGEIYLGGDGLANGYLNRAELTAEKFIDSPFLDNRLHPQKFSLFKGGRGDPLSSKLYKTGDRALYRPNGNIEFLGRTDSQIKLRGFRVELGEIETAIAQYSPIETAVVILREVEKDRQLIAYVVPKASTTPTERELRSFLKTKLPAYMLPAAFVLLNQLPLTANGKVDSKALPPPTIVSATTPTIAPTTSLEASLVQLWAQLLGRKQVGIDDNFFELGGHSLLATQLISRIRDRFQVELPLRSVFETPTIAELAQKIESLTPEIPSLQHQTAGLQRREEIEL